MDDPGGRPDGTGEEPGEPSVSVDVGLEEGSVSDRVGTGDGEVLTPSETFQILASEVRVTVLLELLEAERAGEAPLSFSRLQEAADAESSAGFAYHVRQLSGYLVRKTETGYVLTPAGRRTAEEVVSGTFTVAGDTGRAS